MKYAPTAPWLDPAQNREVVEMLMKYNLLRWSNNRDLPLKSGAKTDVYINLRDARSNPKSIPKVARLFADPIRRLGVQRFVEIPDSVSCFAPHIAEITGLP